MYREFSFTSITTSAIDKSIIVFMTAEVEPQSVSTDSIRLLDCSTNHFVLITYEFVKDKIIITLPTYPIPNSRYKLCIQGIEDIVGNKLERGIEYELQFASCVKSNATVVSPVHGEKISTISVELAESLNPGVAATEPLVGSYYIEIATDNLFYNIIFTSNLIGENKIILKDLHNGQYYLRARVQNDGDYSLWSDVITFVFEQRESTQLPGDDNASNGTDDDIVFHKPLSIIGVPKDGDDASSFYIELDAPIDPDTLDNITVYRRLV